MYKRQQLHQYETQLTQYCFQQLSQVSGLKFIVSGQPDIPVFSFTLEGHHNQDVAATLDSVGIAVRAGHHCAMPLMQYLNIDGCIRLSLAAYNSIEEIDKAVLALNNITSVKLGVESNAIANKNPSKRIIEYSETIEQSGRIEPPLSIENVYALFSQAKSWDSKHREIMMPVSYTHLTLPTTPYV